MFVRVDLLSVDTATGSQTTVGDVYVGFGEKCCFETNVKTKVKSNERNS